MVPMLILFPKGGFRVLNLGHQPWATNTLPAQPSHRPYNTFLVFVSSMKKIPLQSSLQRKVTDTPHHYWLSIALHTSWLSVHSLSIWVWPEGKETHSPSSWLAEEVVRLNCCSRYLPRKAAKPATTAISMQAARTIQVNTGFESRCLVTLGITVGRDREQGQGHTCGVPTLETSLETPSWFILACFFKQHPKALGWLRPESLSLCRSFVTLRTLDSKHQYPTK